MTNDDQDYTPYSLQDDDQTTAQQLASLVSPADPASLVSPAANTSTSSAPAAVMTPAAPAQPSTGDAPSALPASGGRAALAALGTAPQLDMARMQQLQAQRNTDAMPLNRTDPKYKAGLGQKILRGIAATMTGGIPAAITTNYNAPNRQYGIDDQARQAKLGQDTAQIGDLEKNFGENLDSYNRQRLAAGNAITQEKNEATDAGRQERIKQARAGTAANLLKAGQVVTGWDEETGQPQMRPATKDEMSAQQNATLGVTAAKAPLIQAQTAATNAKVPLTQAQTTVANARAKKLAGGDTGIPSAPTDGAAGTDAGGDPLAAIPDSIRAQVKAIGEGRQAPPSRGKEGQALMNWVNKAYPDYDATQFPTYASTRKGFTSGKEGQAINAFNTALGHLGELETHMPNNSSVPLWNQVSNAANRAVGGTKTSAFETAQQAVSDELGKAYSGGSVTDAEHKHYQELLNPNASPAQMKSNFAELKRLLAGKLESYGQQWDSAMPKGNVRPFTVMSPNAARVMGNAAPQAAPQPSSGAQQYEHYAVGQNGHQIGSKGNSWYDVQTGKAIQ